MRKILERVKKTWDEGVDTVKKYSKSQDQAQNADWKIAKGTAKRKVKKAVNTVKDKAKMYKEGAKSIADKNKSEKNQFKAFEHINQQHKKRATKGTLYNVEGTPESRFKDEEEGYNLINKDPIKGVRKNKAY